MKKNRIINCIIIGAYLGFALGAFADIWWYQWQFYAILVPTAVLSNLFPLKAKS